MIFNSVTVYQLPLYASAITQDGARQVRFTSKAHEFDEIHKNESYKNYFWDFLKKAPRIIYFLGLVTKHWWLRVKLQKENEGRLKNTNRWQFTLKMNLIKSTSVIFTQFLEKTPELYFLFSSGERINHPPNKELLRT